KVPDLLPGAGVGKDRHGPGPGGDARNREGDREPAGEGDAPGDQKVRHRRADQDAHLDHAEGAAGQADTGGDSRTDRLRRRPWRPEQSAVQGGTRTRTYGTLRAGESELSRRGWIRTLRPNLRSIVTPVDKPTGCNPWAGRTGVFGSMRFALLGNHPDG